MPKKSIFDFSIGLNEEFHDLIGSATDKRAAGGRESVCVCECERVCVRWCEKGYERGRDMVCVCTCEIVWERIWVCVCACVYVLDKVRKDERVCVIVRKVREEERERVSASVSVWVWERMRERQVNFLLSRSDNKSMKKADRSKNAFSSKKLRWRSSSTTDPNAPTCFSCWWWWQLLALMIRHHLPICGTALKETKG